MSADSLRDERLLELLADRATEGLDAADQRALAALLAERPDLPEDLFELPAAAVQLIGAPAAGAEALPPALEARLRAQAREFLDRRAAARPEVLPFQPRVAAPAPRRRRLWDAGWYAAAASLLLATIGWWLALRPAPAVVPAPPAAISAASPAPPSILAAEVAGRQDAVVRPWGTTEDPAARGVEGEVIWSGELQAGFMRFRGLPPNDPALFQYQLWIFDGNQDERFPIDGGVFDVAPGAAEVVVPIDPKLTVTRPTLFAITIEKPGGVVVSSRERLVLAASV